MAVAVVESVFSANKQNIVVTPIYIVLYYFRCNCCSVVVITLIIFTANRVNTENENGSGYLFGRRTHYELIKSRSTLNWIYFTHCNRKE